MNIKQIKQKFKDIKDSVNELYFHINDTAEGEIEDDIEKIVQEIEALSCVVLLKIKEYEAIQCNAITR